MVRGCEKRIYHVKNTESEIFDEAYFVLRRSSATKSATPREISLEAMRIVNSAVPDNACPSADAKKEKLRAFIAGAALSAATIGLVSTLVWLLL